MAKLKQREKMLELGKNLEFGYVMSLANMLKSLYKAEGKTLYTFVLWLVSVRFWVPHWLRGNSILAQRRQLSSIVREVLGLALE